MNAIEKAIPSQFLHRRQTAQEQAHVSFGVLKVIGDDLLQLLHLGMQHALVAQTIHFVGHAETRQWQNTRALKTYPQLQFIRAANKINPPRGIKRI